MTSNIAAIDPGANGGIAWYSWTDLSVRELVAMPKTDFDIVNYIRNIPVDYFIIEKMMPFAGKAQAGSAAAKYGYNCGLVNAAAISTRATVFEIPPQKWIKHHGLGTRGNLTPTEWKNKLKGFAQKLFPEVNVTLATADALLILRYGIDRMLP